MTASDALKAINRWRRGGRSGPQHVEDRPPDAGCVDDEIGRLGERPLQGADPLDHGRVRQAERQAFQVP